MRRTRSMLTLLSLPVLLSCTETEEIEVASAGAAPVAALASAAANPAIRQEIEVTNARFVEAYNRDDVAGLTDVYTEDATIYPPNMEPIRGKDGIRDFWQAGHEQMGIRNVRLTTDDVETMGNTAWEAGQASFDTKEGAVSGKYMVVWKKTPEGWRWHRDIWNMNPPARRG